jgi:hypothetical protein
MNHILKLQQENQELKNKIEEMENWRMSFLSHLHSEKFQGSDSNGERKDWISTGDVIAQLQNLRSLM